MGIRKIPTVLTASMPTNTGVLTLRRAISEAPSAHTSGARPTMNAMKVIVTARKRSFAPSRSFRDAQTALPLVLSKLDDENGVLGPSQSARRGRSGRRDQASSGPPGYPRMRPAPRSRPTIEQGPGSSSSHRGRRGTGRRKTKPFAALSRSARLPSPQAVTGRQRLRRDFSHGGERSARGDAGRRTSIEGYRAIVVVARDDLRTGHDAKGSD
jgi:hypothetical protein